MSTSSIPIIDIAPFREGTAAEKRRVAAEVNAACESLGFLNIFGHGVSQGLVERMRAVSEEFFHLSLEEKMKLRRPRPEVFRGYFEFCSQTAGYAASEPGELNRRPIVTLPDLRESFAMNRVEVPDDDYFKQPDTRHLFHPNMWPDRPVEMQEIFTEYYQEMERLAGTLMRIFAVALNLREDFFEDKIDKHFTNMISYYYPEQSEAPPADQLRTGPHSDYGSLSILYAHPADPAGGLEVLSPEGEWLPVPVPSGSFVVNLGDLMALWTNDRWTSTMHRVVNPPRHQAMTRRQSVLFFHQPNYDAVISCLDNCWDADHPPKYPPITSGENLRRQLSATTPGLDLV